MSDFIMVIKSRGTFEQRCKHFLAMSEHKSCAAGVVYREIRLEHHPPVRYSYDRRSKNPYSANFSLPCLLDTAFGATCPKSEFPSAEEIKAHKVEVAASLARTAQARAAIIAEIEKAGVLDGSCAGSMACPVCGTGVLHYSRSSHSGHVHGACSTEKCVGWNGTRVAAATNAEG